MELTINCVTRSRLDSTQRICRDHLEPRVPKGPWVLLGGDEAGSLLRREWRLFRRWHIAKRSSTDGELDDVAQASTEERRGGYLR